MSAVAGPVLIVAGMALIGLTDNIVTLIAKEAGLAQMMFLRSAIALPLIFAAAAITKAPLRPVRLPAILIRSTLLAAAMIIYLGAIPFLPIALVAAGLFTAPIFVLIFSTLFFGQRPGPVRITAALVGFAGVLVILNPASATLSLAMGFPILAGAIYGFASLVTRHHCAAENTLTLLIGYYAVVGLVGALAAALLPDAGSFVLRGWVPPTPSFLGWVTFQAVFATIAVWLLTRAYQIADPTRLAVFEYSFLIFASLWAYLLFGQTVGPREILGMGMIAGAGGVISLRNAA